MRRKVLIVLALAVFGVPFLLDLGPGVARADTFSGKSGNKCDTSELVVFSMPLDGTVASLTVLQTKLVVEASTVVVGYWRLSTGASPGIKYWQGPGTFFSYYGDGKPGSNYLRMNVTQGTTGTASFVLRKTGDYGGCWTVSNTGIEVLRYQSGSGGGGSGGGGLVPTPTPDPSASPSPTPNASTPGYCADPDYDPTIPGTGPFVPCETPGPTPTPAPTCGSWQAVTITEGVGGQSVPGYKLVVCPAFSASLASGSTAVTVFDVPTLPSITAINGGGLRLYGRAACPISYTGSGMSLRFWVGTSEITSSVGATQAGSCSGITQWQLTTATVGASNITMRAKQGTGGGGASWSGNGTSDHGADLWWMPALAGGIYPWDQPDVSPTPTPAPPSASPTLPPSFAPSLPPNPWPQDSNGNAIDCTASEWVGKTICEDVPTYSFAPGAMDPDGVAQLLDQMEGKAPFGYAYQAADAIQEATAGAAGAAMPECFTLGTGAYAVEVCLPLDEVAGALVGWRNVFLAMFLIVIALGVIRLAQSAAGGGTSGGSGA